MSPPSSLESRVAVLERELDRLLVSQTAMADDVREIRDAVIGAKGGWKVVVLIGGAGAALGAFFAKLLPLIIKIP